MDGIDSKVMEKVTVEVLTIAAYRQQCGFSFAGLIDSISHRFVKAVKMKEESA